MASSASMLINYPTTFCGVRNSSNPNNDQFSDQINIPSSLNNNINISKITSKTNKIIPKAVASPVIPSINSNNITTTTTPNIKRIIHEFDPKVPAEDGFTPPSTWYTDPSLYSHELDRIFYKGWQVAGYSDQIKEPNQYFTGSLGNVEYLVCRDGQGKVHAFHNVCTHRASILACGTGKKSCFVCPYHGWVFGLDGSLMKATKTENQVFDPQELGLVTLKVAIWGPFVLISLDRSGSEGTEDVGKEWIGSCAEEVKKHAFDASLQFINRSEFPMESNWKVFCDNYLDSAYHVPYAHKYYAAELDFDTYKTDLLEKVVIQRVASSSNKPNGFDRLGSEAFYAFIYPNFAVERYGPWMTTMHIVPLGPRKCKLVVDYYLDKSMMNDKPYIEKSIKINDNVQKEDVVLCESVQRGLETPAYRSGRYVMPIEKGIHHFHCWLHQTLN
ncbi:choline monooxygenase, chloroplastic [Amaranthus tricolor]|uniref:choline monooxygenase, chloroplastic n=1 Tax=Amaranthus tricolor TaxID=29722 RepID=UPI002585EAA7|nr:choline monooxygenase, chloroplastic [Amaranthus tricolor]